MEVRKNAIPTFQEAVCLCDVGRLADEVVLSAGRGSQPLRVSLSRAIKSEALESIGEIRARDFTKSTAVIAVRRVTFLPQHDGSVLRNVGAIYLDKRGMKGPVYSSLHLRDEDVFGCAIWPGATAGLADRYEMLAGMLWKLIAEGVLPKNAGRLHRICNHDERSLKKLEWMVQVARQWDYSLPDPLVEERFQRAKSYCRLLNRKADARFIRDASEAERYLNAISRLPA